MGNSNSKNIKGFDVKIMVCDEVVFTAESIEANITLGEKKEPKTDK